MPTFSDAQIQEALGQRFKVKRYGLPGFDGQFVGIRALSDTEMDACRVRATEHVKKSKMAERLEIAVDPTFFDRALHREIVAASFRDPDNHEAFYFSKADDVAQFDAQTVLAMYEMFCMHQVSMDPYAYASEEEVTALVEQLGKPESDVESLSLFDARSLRSCLLSLASLHRATVRKHSSATS